MSFSRARYWILNGPETVRRIKRISREIARELNISGPFNIQYLARENDIKVIAVSYTHLDVYKRQTLPCAREWMWTGRGILRNR